MKEVEKMSRCDSPRPLTVRQFAEKYPAFSESTIRWLRFRAQPVTRRKKGKDGEVVLKEFPPNGFASAFLEICGRLLVDEGEFWRIVNQQNSQGANPASGCSAELGP